MDIDLLSKMVSELILDSDEVALPGVGTFVAEEVPSSFSDRGYTINPPYRRLSFRQRESSDTGLLDLYARSNGLDLNTASSFLLPFLKEMAEILKEKKTIVLPGLGRLRATRENNFFFVPDEDLNIYPDGFGLESVSLKTHVETEDEVKSAMAGLQNIMESDVDEMTMEEAQPQESEEFFVEPVEELRTVASDMEPQSEPVMQSADAENQELTVPSAEEEQAMHPVDVEQPEQPLLPVDGEQSGQAAEPEDNSHREPLRWSTDNGHHPSQSRAQVPGNVPGQEKSASLGVWWKAILTAVAAVAAILLLFVLIAHIAPDFIDSILYSDEELEVIRKYMQ